LPADGILPGAKFTLRPTLASPILTALLHGTPAAGANFAVWYKEWNYTTFADGATYIQLGGHHAGHRPTF